MNNVAPLRAFEEPAPHYTIHNFLGEELIQRLLAHAKDCQSEFSPTRVVNRMGGKVNTRIRTSSILRDFGPLKDELEMRFRSVLAQTIRELRLSPIDLARLELELVAHGDGAFYKQHIDTMTALPDAASDRALTGVYYFHELPKRFSGGALRLLSILPPDKGGTFVDIEPDRDMLLLFPSWAPHEVRPISCPSGIFLQGRFAINCWYRNRRPISKEMIPAAFRINPLIDTVITQTGGITQINISAYTTKRGFFQQVIDNTVDSCFDAAMRILRCPELKNFALKDLSFEVKKGLWNAGLLIDLGEQLPPFVLEVEDIRRDFYLANGFVMLATCLTSAALSALLSHYRSALDHGKLTHDDGAVDRFQSHNDPAGRVMQRALLKMVERIVSNPIKSSYTYASLYRCGAELPVHNDRPQCKYTVSLLLDHQPASIDGHSSWPLHLYLQPDEPPEECFLTLGGGLLFRGEEIPHGRPRLPTDETCWVLLLHYVDADFEGWLD